MHVKSFIVVLYICMQNADLNVFISSTFLFIKKVLNKSNWKQNQNWRNEFIASVCLLAFVNIYKDAYHYWLPIILNKMLRLHRLPFHHFPFANLARSNTVVSSAMWEEFHCGENVAESHRSAKTEYQQQTAIVLWRTKRVWICAVSTS